MKAIRCLRSFQIWNETGSSKETTSATFASSSYCLTLSRHGVCIIFDVSSLVRPKLMILPGLLPNAPITAELIGRPIEKRDDLSASEADHRPCEDCQLSHCTSGHHAGWLDSLLLSTPASSLDDLYGTLWPLILQLLLDLRVWSIDVSSLQYRRRSVAVGRFAGRFAHGRFF